MVRTMRKGRTRAGLAAWFGLRGQRSEERRRGGKLRGGQQLAALVVLFGADAKVTDVRDRLGVLHV